MKLMWAATLAYAYQGILNKKLVCYQIRSEKNSYGIIIDNQRSKEKNMGMGIGVSGVSGIRKKIVVVESEEATRI